MNIYSLLNRVESGELVLPNIQRSFVWKQEDICKLMDSIMRGYPIGIVLMWETYEDIQYRRFTKNYVQEADFDYSSNLDKKKLLLVLDGQQRLQSLFIALYGKYEKKELYFQLLSGQEKDDSSEFKYDFYFFTEGEADDENQSSIDEFSDPTNDDPTTDHEKWFWVPVRRLFDMSYDEQQDRLDEIRDLIHLDRRERQLIERNVGYLKENFQQNEHVLKHSTLDENKPSTAKNRKTVTDILEVFVRVNNAGTKLTKSDLIFSMLKLNWKESAVDLPSFVKQLNADTDFDFDKDFVIKCLFSVSGFGPKYDIEVLRKKKNIDIIMGNYQSCCDAIRSCLDFIRQQCWITSQRSLPGYNILIPFVYYVYRLPENQIPASEIGRLRKFFYVAAFTRLFTSYAEPRIRVFIRDYLCPHMDKDALSFPLEAGLEFLRRYEAFEGVKEDHLNGNIHLVLNLVQRHYDMKLLYDRNRPEIDHIFPKSTLRQKGIPEHAINYFANYWYLPMNKNRNKSDKHPKEFFKSIGVTDNDLRSVFIEPELLDFRRYSTFVDDRGSKIKQYVLSALEMREGEFEKPE